MSASILENHLKMLQTFAEEQVERYVADVVNKGNTDAKVENKYEIFSRIVVLVVSTSVQSWYVFQIR